MTTPNEGGAPAENTPGEGGESTPAPSGDSVLSTGGQAPAPIHERIPEKYRVFEGEGDDKAFNLEASASKMAEGYGSLAKKLGSDDLPPDAPENYKIDSEAFGEDFNAEEFLKDEGTQSFLKRMHAKGMTNSQVQEVLEFGLKEWAPNLQAGNQVLSAEDCITQLRSEWQNEEEYNSNMEAANRAFRSLPQDVQSIIDKELGNNPAFNRVMALFGKEMSEDSTPVDSVPSGQDQANIETLMMSEEYKNPAHPQHDIVSRKVQAYFQKQFPKAS